MTGYPALDAGSGRPAADDSADGVDRQPAPWIAFDAAAPSHAAKQRPVLEAGGRGVDFAEAHPVDLAPTSTNACSGGSTGWPPGQGNKVR